MEKKISEQDIEKARQEDKRILPDVKNIKAQETFTLPSKGYLYAPEDNIGSSLTLRRMTTAEDKMRLRNASDDEIKKAILQACILNENIDAGKLKLVDANYLFFRLRCISLLNDMYKVTCYCNRCRTEFVHELNLTQVPVTFLSKDKLKNMSFELPISKDRIELKYPSLNDLIRISSQLADYFEKFPNADRGETAYTISGVLYINTVNGNHLLTEELEYYLDNMDIIDGKLLRDKIGQLDDFYGFQNNLKTKCPKCGSEVTHGLPLTSELFNPSN